MDKKAIVLAHHADELILLANIVQQAGLLVDAYTRFGSLVQGWPEQLVNLVVVAHQTEEIAQAVHYASRISAAPIIAITDFINDEMRMALYAAGAALVLVRPYSPRLLMVQAGMMAQKMDSMIYRRASALLILINRIIQLRICVMLEMPRHHVEGSGDENRL